MNAPEPNEKDIVVFNMPNGARLLVQRGACRYVQQGFAALDALEAKEHARHLRELAETIERTADEIASDLASAG